MQQDLKEFIDAVNWETLKKVNDWEISLNDEIIDFQLNANDGERYIVRFLCDNYPNSAPSVYFINEQGDKMDKTAWPTGDQEFLQHFKPPQHSFICMPLTREGLAHHRDWISSPSINSWNPQKHTLLDIMNFLQQKLGSKHYLRRGS
ncbi:hypothetical protein RZN22_13470 [Bacillaceae bacterium S4-13-58]